MSTTREEVMATLGIDATQIEKGLGIGRSYASKWVQQVKEVETGYTGWWNTELKKREEMEVAAAVRAATRANRARKLLREREEARSIAAQAEQTAANTVIGSGSLPAGWAEQAAARKAGIELEKKAAAALKETAEGGHASAGAFREFAVLVREGFRGNYTRMIGSFSILLQRLGLTATALGGLAAVAAEVGAILYYAISTGNATKQLQASQKREREATGENAGRLREDIAELVKAGKMSQEAANRYLGILAHPTLERNTLVSRELRQRFGGTNKHDADEAKRLDEEHEKKMLEYAREDMDLQHRTWADEGRRLGIKAKMASLDPKSLEYKQLQLEYDEAARDVQQDLRKAKEGELEIQHKVNQEQKIYDEAKLRISEIQQREREKFMPTLEEFARHGGPAGHAARQILRGDRRIKRDLFHGDTAGADRDIASRNKLYDSLASRGLVPERAEQREIRRLNEEMQLHLKNIAEGKALLKTKLAMG